jgi:hypothetical protein
MCSAVLQCGDRCVILRSMRPLPRWFVAVCAAFAVLFSIAVGLQVNDPDPVRWSALYGGAAIAVALLIARREAALVGLAVGVVAAVWGAMLTSQVYDKLAFSDLWLRMSEKGGAVEVGREAGGLVIVAVMLLALSAYRLTRTD